MPARSIQPRVIYANIVRDCEAAWNGITASPRGDTGLGNVRFGFMGTLLLPHSKSPDTASAATSPRIGPVNRDVTPECYLSWVYHDSKGQMLQDKATSEGPMRRKTWCSARS